MAFVNYRSKLLILLTLFIVQQCQSNDILGCGGFVKSHVSLDYSKIEIALYTSEGSLKEKTECAPTNGYYFLPLYEKGDYVLKVHPPAGWSFEPSQVNILVDGETDQCSTSQDINFSFNGFGITGKVITAGQNQGPRGINVQLVNDKGDVRNAVTTVGGEFHFTPVIPGKYVVKATHSKWKLEPSQAVVQVKEGNTVLPVGSLAVKGYDVTGTVSSFGNPISGIYVLLYSKQESPKLRVEDCKTGLLQGVPDAPICYSVTDASGVFNFGLVPAGDYKLLAMVKTPGQTTVIYNIKADTVPFNVQHDSLYIKNAFEVTGFNIIGSVLKFIGGSGISGVRVLMGGEPVATTDKTGQFQLNDVKPGAYMLSFQHEQCEVEDMQVKVTSSGVSSAVTASAARWRVCGALVPAARRSVAVHASIDRAPYVTVNSADDGTWCTFLPTGAYSAKVEVTEQEQRDGLQFFPEWQQISVGSAPVAGVSFSQVRARVRGRVRCGAHCRDVHVELRPLAADGGYTGPPRTAPLKDEMYVFEEVAPGSVQVSVVSAHVCWREERHNVVVTHDLPDLPDFELSGLKVRFHVSHSMEVEYSAEGGVSGVLVMEGSTRVRCLPPAARYELTPRGCHRVQPPRATLDLTASADREDDVPSVKFVAVAHAALVSVTSPVAVERLVLHTRLDGARDTVTLTPTPHPTGQHYVYEHTLYLTEGAVAEVSLESHELVFPEGSNHRVRGARQCQFPALKVRAVRATYVSGQLDPPVAGVTVTLTGDNLMLIHVTKEDGKYNFGPLDASEQYAVSAKKESYVFGKRGADGIIAAHKLAEISVQLLDKADGKPLESALVSASGGAYRRNVAADAGGHVVLRDLQATQYYVKPNMKEYRFEPPHAIVDLSAGEDHKLIFKGTRVAWSALGRVVSLGGVGVARAALRALPREAGGRCAPQDASADDDGHFRIRGLVPGCVYDLQLKESSAPDLVAAEVTRAPPPLEVKGADIEGLRLIVYQPTPVTDVSVFVYASNVEHYRTLRLTLAAENGAGGARAPYTARLEPPPPPHNPGLLHQLPRLPADNRTYTITLDSSLSRAAHTYADYVVEFTADGQYKHFDVHFEPKVKATEQEVRAGSVAFLLLATVMGVLFWQRQYLSGLTALAPLAGILQKLEAPKKPPRKKLA